MLKYCNNNFKIYSKDKNYTALFIVNFYGINPF